MIHSPRQRRLAVLSAFLGSLTRASRTPKPRQRGLTFKIGTALFAVMAVLVGTAAAAFANAANPYVNPPQFVTGGTADGANGTVQQNADGSYTVLSGTVAVNVDGTWNWGALSGSSAQSSCESRFGVGWAVDWSGVSNSASAPNSLGSLTIGKKNGTGFFHLFESDMIAAGDYYGFQGPCTAQELSIEPGHPSGPWSSSHTYDAGDKIPQFLCVNMYDLHGSPGSLKAGDENPLTNHDNSIQTNDFNPQQGGGYCFSPTFINTQHLKANIYDCTNGPTTTEVVGTVSAAGPTTIAEQANPLDNGTVKAGDYTVTATAPSGYHFVQCQAGLPRDSDGTATRAVNVPVDGTGAAVFYVAQNPKNPALDIVKSASTSQVTAGESFDYMLIVSSIGDTAATSVVVTDAIPAGLTVVGTPSATEGTCGVSGQDVTCNLGDLAAASAPTGTKSVAIGIHVRTSPTTCGVVTNTGQVSASNVNRVDSNPVDVTVNCPINGELVKVNDADGNGAFHQSETASLPNTDVAFQVTFTNSSAVPVVIDSIADAFGSSSITPDCNNFVGSTVAAGDSITCAFTLAKYSPAAGTSVTNTATVTVHDKSDSNKKKTVEATSVVNTAGQPPLVLEVVKTNDADGNGSFTKDETGTAEANVNFQVQITNKSAVAVVVDSVTDVWPGAAEFAPACAAALVGHEIAPGETVTCNFTVEKYVPVSADGAKVNTVTVTGHQPGNPGNTTTQKDTSTVRGAPPAVLGTTVVRALPRTGSNTFGLVAIAVLLLIVGFGLTMLGNGRLPQAALALRSSALVAPVMYSRSVLVVERELGGVSRRKLKGR